LPQSANIYLRPIISASRRTDLPAFYGEWLQAQVRQGYVELPQPFSRRIRRVDLNPAAVGAWVFWSKNYQPFFSTLDFLAGVYHHRFLFHYTLNGFHAEAARLLEPGVPPAEISLATVQDLLSRFGRECISWRFDPVIFSTLTPYAERLETFRILAEKLCGLVGRCHISFVDLYGKVARRLRAAESRGWLRCHKPSEAEQVAFAEELREIAQVLRMPLYTCCEDAIGAQAGITPGHCVDAILLRELYPGVALETELRPTRRGCGCYYSIDIGQYNTCRHACLYCYASR